MMPRRSVKTIGSALAVLFAVVGLVFLVLPGGVLRGLNAAARFIGYPEGQSPVVGAQFYLVLAVAYMAVVTALAALIARHPDHSWFPLLLAIAKVSSAVLSLGLALFDRPYLVYLANGAVDGAIGGLALVLFRRARRAGEA
jgi:cytochrome bd-type quinol oxidase subunit 2